MIKNTPAKTSDSSVLGCIRVSDKTLQAVVDEHLVRQATKLGSEIDARDMLSTPERKSLALRYVFEGCAMSALAFSAPNEVFARALRECTVSTAQPQLHDAAYLSWIKEMRASAFLASVEGEKLALEKDPSVQNSAVFDIEGRVNRFLSALF